MVSARRWIGIVGLVSALGLGGRAIGAAEADILIVHNSGQPRWVPPLTCARCDSIDLAAGELPRRGYRTVILDGHSLPPRDIIGVSMDRLREVLARAGAETVIAATCYGAELDLLETMLTASERTRQVLAAPNALPWAGITWREGCLDEGADAVHCIEAGGRLIRYAAGDIQALRRRAAELFDAVIACEQPAPYVRLRPTFLCVPGEGGRNGLLHVTLEQLDRPCAPRRPEDVWIVACDSDSPDP